MQRILKLQNCERLGWVFDLHSGGDLLTWHEETFKGLHKLIISYENWSPKRYFLSLKSLSQRLQFGYLIRKRWLNILFYCSQPTSMETTFHKFRQNKCHFFKNQGSKSCQVYTNSYWFPLRRAAPSPWTCGWGLLSFQVSSDTRTLGNPWSVDHRKKYGVYYYFMNEWFKIRLSLLKGPSSYIWLTYKFFFSIESEMKICITVNIKYRNIILQI